VGMYNCWEEIVVSEMLGACTYIDGSAITRQHTHKIIRSARIDTKLWTYDDRMIMCFKEDDKCVLNDFSLLTLALIGKKRKEREVCRRHDS